MQNNLKIRFAKKEECKILENLSELFSQENCCNNIIADKEEFFINKKVAIAIFNGEIVGYCYGNINSEEVKKSYADIGDKYYDLEEIYILKDFRNQKIGERLFKFMENYALKKDCKTIRLNAVSKNYKQLLHFYLDCLGMEFISAYLVKKIN